MLNNIDHGYANILFTYGKKNDCLKKYYEDSLWLLKILEENTNLMEIITNASLPKEERKLVIKDLFAESFDQTYLYFLWVVIDLNRARELIRIIKFFLKQYQDSLHISYASVTTAYPLSKEEQIALMHNLKTSMNLHEVVLHCVIDKSLIGGIKVKINNITLDDTIKNKLSKMKQSIFELHHGK